MNENNQPPIESKQPVFASSTDGAAPSAAQPSTIDPLSTGPKPSQTKDRKQMGMAVMLLAVLVAAIAAGGGGYAYGKSKAKSPTTLISQKDSVPELTVPQGATVISKCSDGKGALYALPKDIPTGPVYLKNNGKVIGLEFMVGKDDLLTAGKSFLNLPMFNQKYDHVNIGLLSQGHAGFPIPHYHVDLFTVSNAEASAIKCTSS